MGWKVPPRLVSGLIPNQAEEERRLLGERTKRSKHLVRHDPECRDSAVLPLNQKIDTEMPCKSGGARKLEDGYFRLPRQLSETSQGYSSLVFYI